MTASNTMGTLFLIPTPLGNQSPIEILPFYIRKIMEEINYFIVENEKEARRFIKKIAPNKNLESIELFPLNKFTAQIEIEEYLEPCKMGNSMGLFSDAGCPGIADPGAAIVRLAHRYNIRVKPMVGPSSILLAMMASGMNGQQFAFNGYLPVDKTARKKKIKHFENTALKTDQAQLFIETPYRSNQLFEDLLKNLRPDTRLCVACDLTLETEWIYTQPVSAWKKNKPELDRRPTVFAFDCDFLSK